MLGYPRYNRFSISLHSAEQNASQQKHNYGKESDDAKIDIKRKRAHVEQSAADAVHCVGQRIEFDQALQPQRQLIIHRKKSAGKEEKRKDNKCRNDLKAFQTLQH